MAIMVPGAGTDTVMTMTMDVTPQGLVEICQRHKETDCLNLEEVP
jgi:hypothetical protein